MSSSGHDLLFDWVLPDVRWRIAYNIIMAGFNQIGIGMEKFA